MLILLKVAFVVGFFVRLMASALRLMRLVREGVRVYFHACCVLQPWYGESRFVSIVGEDF